MQQQISLEQLKPLASRIVAELDKDREPLDDLRAAEKLLDEVLASPGAFASSQAAVFFYDDFLCSISNSILHSIHFKDREVISTVMSILKKVVVLFAREVPHDNEAFVRRMHVVFDEEMYFFREFGIRRVEYPGLIVNADTEEEKGWRQALKKGDRVDVVKTEQPSLVGWTTGTVEDRMADLLTVSFDGEASSLDRTLSASSKELAPYGSHTGGTEWRKGLGENARADCLDSSGTWYAATVLERKEVVEGKGNRDVVMLKVGYRVYDEHGPKKDALGRTFFGWSANFDEWISSHSLRIQKPGSLARKGLLKCNKNEDEDDKKHLDDAGDVLLNSLHGKETFAVLRPDKSRSEILVDLLNAFGRASGFESILSKLTCRDKEKLISIDIALYYFDIIGQLWYMFHRGFAQDYFPRLQKAMIDYLESAPDVEIRKLQKESVERVCKDLENVLRRVYTVLERCRIQEHFELSMNTRLLKSDYLQLRILGLKGINDICKSAKLGMTRSVSLEFLANWFSKNAVLDELFGTRKHQQLLQRSGTVLKFLHENRLLKTRDLELMWECSSRDDQTRQDLFRVVGEVGFPLNSAELEFFAGKIEGSRPDELCEEALDVIYEPSRYPNRTAEQLLKFAGVMSKIAFRADLPPALSEKALQKYAEMLSPLEFDPHKKAVLSHCINDLLKKNESTILALKLIRKLANQHAPGAKVIAMLITDLSLLEVFFDNFRAYYAQTKASHCCALHPQSIAERMDFLKFVMENSGSAIKRLPIRYVYDLWGMLFESPVMPSDPQAMVKFLKEVASDQTTYVQNFDPKEGKAFFEDKVVGNRGYNYADMSAEAFDCVLRLFILINEHEGSLTVTYPPAPKLRSYTATSYLNPLGPSHSHSSPSKSETTPPEVRTCVHPDKLLGVEVFWRVVQHSLSPEVTRKSRDFLNRLYTHLHGEIESQASNIRAAFISTYLNRLEVLINSPADNEPKGEVLGRMVRLMGDMIDESERQGTGGGLKSHMAILAGELLTLTIHNLVTLDKGVPRKLEVTVRSSLSVWDLKLEVAKYFSSAAECIKLTVGSKELKDTDHGRTLGEFVPNRRACVVIKAEKKGMDGIPRVPLIGKDLKLTAPAKKAFAAIFGKFAKAGKMDFEGAASFIRSTTGEPNVIPTDNRVLVLFKSFDADKDGLLDVEGFSEFYRDSLAHGREDTVWQNLYVHGYRNDLRSVAEFGEGNNAVDAQTLPRYMLSRNPKSFDLFFRILELEEGNDLVWDLITRLSTNELLYSQLFALSEPSGEVKWADLIGTKHVYLLLYNLQIIQYFIDEKNEPKLKAWKEAFVGKGGVAYLVSVLLGGTLDPCRRSVEKECLGFLCQIVDAFIRSAAYALDEGLRGEVANAQSIYKKHLVMKCDVEEELEEIKVPEAMLVDKAGQKRSEEAEKGAPGRAGDMEELLAAKPSSVFSAVRPSSEPDSGFDLPKSMAQLLMSSVSLEKLLIHQLDILACGLSRETRAATISHKDELMIKSSLRLFSTCILSDVKSKGKLFSLAREYPKESASKVLNQLIPAGLFCSASPLLREEFMDVFFSLCYLLNSCGTKDDSSLSYVLDVLLSNIPRKNSADVKDCGEYFHLMGKLIDLKYATSTGKCIETRTLLETMLEMLRQHRSAEKKDSQLEDKLLVGIISTVRKIVAHEERMKEEAAIKQGLLHELFFNCLFPSLAPEEVPALIKSESQEGAMDSQKCKSRESRVAAYKLLTTLCRGSLNCQSFLLHECLEPLCKSIRPHKGWAYIPASESRSRLGFSGLKNLGCICYMLSMIQQFYLIPTFRYGILAADDRRPIADKNPEGIDDNVLHQFQRIFAYLELTERQDYNIRQFCFAFKDLDGKPTNVTHQQDAQEFLNLIFDRLENLLRATPEKYLLQGIFGGKTCSQIICKGGCGSVKKNYEDFYNLSLGVKGNKSLFESLDKYISGENISGYFCEKCGKKVEVVKRTCLHELPNVLIIHLQRLIFNYDTMMNEKVNSRLEFPKEFSIEPYTLEGLDGPQKKDGKDEGMHYRYKLVGVVVHCGVADMGHYYSYININRSKVAAEQGDTEKDTWLEFNDSYIRLFDFNKLESECFGGSNDVPEESIWGGTFRPLANNMKNAYILVYERKQKSPLMRLTEKPPASTLDCEHTAQARVATTNTNIADVHFDPKTGECFELADFYSVKPHIPAGLYREVWEDNSDFVFERQVYSPEFFRFVQDVLKEAFVTTKATAPAVEISMTRVAARVIFEVLARAYHNESIKPMVEQLIELLHRSAAASLELLDYLSEDPARLFAVLAKCPDKDVRICVEALVCEMVGALLPLQDPEWMHSEIVSNGTVRYKSKLAGLLASLCEGVGPELAQNWLRFEQYLDLLGALAKCGDEKVVRFYHEKNMLARLLDFYLGAKSPLAFTGKGEKRSIQGNKIDSPKFSPLVDLVCFLALKPDLTKLIGREYDKPANAYPLRGEEKLCLESREFVEKTVIQGFITPQFSNLISLLIFENEKRSKKIAKLLLCALSEDSIKDMAPQLELLKHVLLVQDSLQRKRLEWLLGIGTLQKTFVLPWGSVKPHEQIKFGLEFVDGQRENVTDYTSVLTYNSAFDSVLNLAWRRRTTSGLSPIRCLLSLMVESLLIFDYISGLPPPTYSFAKYIDWMRPLVEGHRSGCRLLYGRIELRSAGSNTYEETKRLLDEVEQRCDAFLSKHHIPAEAGVLRTYPPAYLIGCPLEQKVLFEETKDGVTLVLTEIITEAYVSLPTGTKNAGIPRKYADKIKEKNGVVTGENIMKPLSVEPTVLKIEVVNRIILGGYMNRGESRS